jgi:competence protein ComEC
MNQYPLKEHYKIKLIQTANVFKLLVMLGIIFIFSNVLNLKNILNENNIIIIGCVVAIIGAIVGIVKNKTIGFYLFSIALGIFIYADSTNNYIDISNNFAQQQPAIIKGKVTQTLRKLNDKQRIIIEGNIYPKHLPQLTNTKIILTIINDTLAKYNKIIQQNDSVLIKAAIRFPSQKVFDYDFDEFRYVRNYGASLMGFANERNVSIVRNPNDFSRIRNDIVKNIESKIDILFTKQTAEFIKTILLANQSELNPEIKKDFRIAGISHLLAVSGFHLGIISVVI